VNNDGFCQRLADLTGLPVERPKITETTALGAAYLAGLSVGLFKDISALSKDWALDRRFDPSIAGHIRDTLYEGWKKAVARIRAN
jgi:glycerol kinase